MRNLVFSPLHRIAYGACIFISSGVRRHSSGKAPLSSKNRCHLHPACPKPLRQIRPFLLSGIAVLHPLLNSGSRLRSYLVFLPNDKVKKRSSFQNVFFRVYRHFGRIFLWGNSALSPAPGRFSGEAPPRLRLPDFPGPIDFLPPFAYKKRGSHRLRAFFFKCPFLRTPSFRPKIPAACRWACEPAAWYPGRAR